MAKKLKEINKVINPVCLYLVMLAIKQCFLIILPLNILIFSLFCSIYHNHLKTKAGLIIEKTLRKDELIDIIWSPLLDNEFLVYDNDIYLYRVVNKNSLVSESLIKICEETCAELVANYSENSNPRVVAWNLDKDNPNMLALAAGFERIRTEHSILVWDIRGSTSSNTIFESTTESVITTSLPAQKNKNSHTISTDLSSITMGINLGVSPSIYNYNFGIDGKKPDMIKSIYETGSSETCNSLSWNPHNEYNLLAGVNSKSLKIYDTRGNNKAGLSVNTKFVNCFVMDGASNSIQNQAASFCDNIVALWDIRSFDKPIHQINENDIVQKIQWSPKKSGQLAILPKNSNTINIYTVKNINNSLNASVAEDENAPTQLTIDKISRKCPTTFRTRTFSTPFKDARSNSINNKNPINASAQILTQRSTADNFITNFCWYNFDANKILIATNFLVNNLRSLCLPDTIVLTWSPNGDLCWSSNLGRVNQIENFDKSEFDFTSNFKERTKSDYGLKYDIITITNETAVSVPSTSSFNTPHSTSSPLLNMSALPLALALNKSLGLTSLVRSDFLSNTRLDEFKNIGHENASIKYLWKWFESVNRFFETVIPINPRNNQLDLPLSLRNSLIELYPTRYCGLKSLLNDFLLKRQNSNDPTFDDRFRMIAYNLCGWDFKDGNMTSQFFTNLEKSNQFERATCLALLTENFDQALEILENASNSDSRYGCLWIALKYFYDEQKLKDTKIMLFSHQSSLVNISHSSPTPKSPSSSSSVYLSQNSFNSPNNKSPFFEVNSTLESTPTHKSSLIRDINIEKNQALNSLILKECSRLIENFNNAYLKGLFSYLINKDEAILKILHDRNILFQDRIGLSVYFMYHSNQTRLQQYFDFIIEEECMKHADLHGILLTGLGPKCIDLFQCFIDKTNDIQTASLAIIHTPYVEVLHSKQVQYWIHSYRELLNRFKFWEKRAEFDVFKMKLLKSQNFSTTPGFNNSSSAPLYENMAHFGIDSNVSSSSSSSFTSSNFGNVTPTPKFQQQAQYLNPHHSQSGHLNRFSSNQLLNNKNNSKFNSQNQFQPSYLQQPASSNIQSPYVHYFCNKCGKNLLEKSHVSNSLITQHHFSQTNVPLNQHLSINTKSFSINNISSTAHNNSTSKNLINDFSINGCLSCGQFLPQCVICLHLMKINLQSNCSISPCQNANQNTNNLQLNRSQSLFIHPSNAKLLINNKNKQLLLQSNNSPNSGLIIENNSQAFQNNSLKHQTSKDDENEIINVKLADNYIFINSTKFGNWFAWCQTCKHGGHIKHLIDWFKYNKKCPYIHCECFCINIDFEH